jgi:hypothetical protein
MHSLHVAGIVQALLHLFETWLTYWQTWRGLSLVTTFTLTLGTARVGSFQGPVSHTDIHAATRLRPLMPLSNMRSG